METRQTVGLLGSLLLFLGVFAPIVSVPIIGSQNYFQNGSGDGVVIAILALLSVVTVCTRRYRALWWTGLASLGVLVFTFVTFQMKLSQLKQQMNTELADNPFKGLADVAVQSVQLQWGWAILVVGVVLVLVAAAMKPAPGQTGAA